MKSTESVREWRRVGRSIGLMFSCSVLFMGWVCVGPVSADSELKKVMEKAERGDVAAQVDLGWRYQHGEGVKRDIQKALEWYKKAAEQGVAQAEVNIAVIYDAGDGVPENNELANEWYEKAAAKGHVVAMLNLGINYWKGEGVEQNYEKAWNMLNMVRMTSRDARARWAARDALDSIKAELGIKNGMFSYPAWDKLDRE